MQTKHIGLNLPQYVPDYTIRGIEMRFWTQPIVYGWRRGDKYLYIGCGQHGIDRPFSFVHHVIGVKDKVRESDKLDIWLQLSYTDALTFERMLIERYRPMYNGLKAQAETKEESATISQKRGILTETEVHLLIKSGRYNSLRHRMCLECGRWFWTNLYWQEWCGGNECLGRLKA